ncbi:MAG TPA: hypothetical protein VF283_23610 [Bryobacteraceae bacterium]
MEFFRDLMANEELYFRRTDLYKADDPNEGLPTDKYLRQTLKLDRYVLDDELELNHRQAFNRLHSQCYYLSCWTRYDPDNRLRMWHRYAPYGVAIRSDYSRLKAALAEFLDDVHVGSVRYGDEDMTGYNLLQILFTKGCNYAWENEVRAVVCSYDPVGGQARNFRETNFPYREPHDDLNPLHPWVHTCKRRRVHLKNLIVGIAVSPWASDKTFNEVRQSWANIRDYKLPVQYDLKSSLTPTIDELEQRGWPKQDRSECNEQIP